MATTERYQTASGATAYMARWRTPSGTQSKKRGFATKRDAEDYANTVETDKLSGAYVAPALGRITVGELAPLWLARKVQLTAPSHSRMLESAYKVHVGPAWGSTPVADIDVLGIETWIATMGSKGAGATTVLRAYGVLSGILSDAVKSRRLQSNPCHQGVDNLPRKTGKRHVYLSAADVARLAQESGQHRALVLTLAYTGIRWGEAVALRVADVEFLRRRLTVHANAVQLGVDHAVGATKGKAVRSVPVPAFVLDELSVQCAGKAAGDLVFGVDGFLPRPKSDGGWFAGAVKRAGVQPITPHDLRHTCASLAVSAGANVLAVARMLGHKDPSVTLRIYADLFDTDLDRVAEALNNLGGQGARREGKDA